MWREVRSQGLLVSWNVGRLLLPLPPPSCPTTDPRFSKRLVPGAGRFCKGRVISALQIHDRRLTGYRVAVW